MVFTDFLEKGRAMAGRSGRDWNPKNAHQRPRKLRK